MPAPRPENIGDIYRIWGYQGLDLWRYGVTYQGTDPGNDKRWCWWISMDDGDQYLWLDDEPEPDLMGHTRMELVRRNPIPDWKAAESDASLQA